MGSRFAGLIIVLNWLVCSSLGSQTPPTNLLTPVDEARGIPLLEAARAVALNAATARNSGVLAGLTVRELQDVVTQGPSFDKFWNQAQKALRNGGRFRTDQESGERQFCAPWAEEATSQYSSIPLELVGPEGIVPGVVMQPLKVYASPDMKGQPIGTVGAGRVKILREPLDEDVLNVELPGGASGWASAAHLWTTWDGQVCFALRQGDWRIVAIGPP